MMITKKTTKRPGGPEISKVTACLSATGHLTGYRATHASFGSRIVRSATFSGRGDTLLAANRWLLGAHEVFDQLARERGGK